MPTVQRFEATGDIQCRRGNTEQSDFADFLLISASRAILEMTGTLMKNLFFFKLSIDFNLGSAIRNDWDDDEKHVFCRLSIDFNFGCDIRNDWDPDEKYVFPDNLLISAKGPLLETIGTLIKNMFFVDLLLASA